MTESTLAPRARRGERGSILVAGLVGTFVATLLAIALFDLGVVQNRLYRDNVCTRRAVHAAEAGLLRTFQDIERANSGTAMNFNTLAKAGGGGTLSTTLASLGGAYTDVPLRSDRPDMYSVSARIVPPSCPPYCIGSGPRTIRLVSTGRVPTGCLQEGGEGAIATVQADLTRQSTPLGAPFVGRDFIKINGKQASTDSYNSFTGKYATSSCPKYDKKGKPVKVLGCGGDLWSDGASVTKLTKNDCNNAAICGAGGATVFGNITAARGGIYLQGKKDKAVGAIWGNASWDTTPADFGWMFCKDSPCTTLVQGSIIKGTIPNIQLADVTDWAASDFASGGGTRCGGAPSSGLFSSESWLAGQVTVYDKDGKAQTCSAKNKWCAYDEKAGTLVIDEKDTNLVVFQQGQYCFESITIKNTTGIALEYATKAADVRPVQWNLKKAASLDDKIKKGKAASGEENDPWMFMLLSACDRSKGCPEMKMQIGAKKPGDDQGLYGYIYAPRAKLKIGGDGDLYGAAVAGAFTIEKDADLHFDQGLLNLIEICPTCPIPPYLTSRPVDTLSRWRRCVAPPGAECP
jgi:hypothetical protein